MKDKADYYVANRDVTISTKYGVTLRFKKDVPQRVPPRVRGLLGNYGILPVEGPPAVNTDPESQLAASKPSPKEVAMKQIADPAIRKEKILEAIASFSENEVRTAFAASGIPKVRELSKAVGFDVTTAERDSIWQEMRQGEQSIQA